MRSQHLKSQAIRHRIKVEKMKKCRVFIDNTNGCKKHESLELKQIYICGMGSDHMNPTCKTCEIETRIIDVDDWLLHDKNLKLFSVIFRGANHDGFSSRHPGFSNCELPEMGMEWIPPRYDVVNVDVYINAKDEHEAKVLGKHKLDWFLKKIRMNLPNGF